MVVVDEEGEVTTTDGVAALMDDPKGELFPWRQKRSRSRTSSLHLSLQAASGPVVAMSWGGLCALAVGFGLGFALATVRAKKVG